MMNGCLWNNMDPYCCEVAWDGQCVSEAATWANCSI